MFSGYLFCSGENVIKDAGITQQQVGTSESETPAPDEETSIVDEDATQLQCNCLFLLQLNIAVMSPPSQLIVIFQSGTDLILISLLILFLLMGVTIFKSPRLGFG